MKAAARISRTRSMLAEKGLDALIVRDTADLMWLTGFERLFDSEQAHVAVISDERCAIHTDSRYSTAMRACAQQEGLWDVDDERCSVASYVRAQVAKTSSSRPRVGIDADTPLSLYRQLCEGLPNVEFVEMSRAILALRAVKEPAEIELMKKAQDIASRSFLQLLEFIRPGMTEREVSLEFEIAMRKNGADELAFANIVASGPNSANPHAVPSNRRLSKGDLVVIDFGARVDGYRSDTTRTICIGEPSDEQVRIYNAVRRANEAVQVQLKAGVTGAQMHKLAEEILAEEGFAGKMGHSLGHGVGIDIHELPLLAPSYDKKLEEGSVVTDEPGIYIAGENGVRIEDCGAVTSDGYVNFCSLTHELQVVE